MPQFALAFLYCTSTLRTYRKLDQKYQKDFEHILNRGGMKGGDADTELKINDTNIRTAQDDADETEINEGLINKKVDDLDVDLKAWSKSNSMRRAKGQMSVNDRKRNNSIH